MGGEGVAASASQVSFPGRTEWRWPVCLTLEHVQDAISPPIRKETPEIHRRSLDLHHFKGVYKLNQRHQRGSNRTLDVYLLCHSLKGFSYQLLGLIRYRSVIFVPILQARTLEERGGQLLTHAAAGEGDSKLGGRCWQALHRAPLLCTAPSEVGDGPLPTCPSADQSVGRPR